MTDNDARPGHEDDHTRWSDWSEIQRFRREGIGELPDRVKRRLKVNRLRAEMGISKHEAQQRMRHDDVEIADAEVDGRPEALMP